VINWLILLCYIIAAFLVMFILDAIWERLQCRACNKISFCNVEIVGLPKKQTEQLKRKLKDKLKEQL